LLGVGHATVVVIAVDRRDVDHARDPVSKDKG
jgi:hypothetical protein